MDMYDSLFPKNCMVNEQIARQLFDVLPDQGPIMVIMDRQGGVCPSDSERFAKLNLADEFLKEVCDKIDDGAEPVVSQGDDYSVIASQLATEQNNYGYVVIILPQYSPESTLINIDLIEILLNEIALIARLIEKNNHLYEHQVRQYSGHPQTMIASN